MPIPANRRKALFKTAIGLSEVSVTAWAAEREISTNHLYQVLDGKRVPSQHLLEEIDGFIRRTIRANLRVLELAS